MCSICLHRDPVSWFNPMHVWPTALMSLWHTRLHEWKRQQSHFSESLAVMYLTSSCWMVAWYVPQRNKRRTNWNQLLCGNQLGHSTHTHTFLLKILPLITQRLTLSTTCLRGPIRWTSRGHFVPHFYCVNRCMFPQCERYTHTHKLLLNVCRTHLLSCENFSCYDHSNDLICSVCFSLKVWIIFCPHVLWGHSVTLWYICAGRPIHILQHVLRSRQM